MQNFDLAEFIDILLCETSSTRQLSESLDSFSEVCSQISGIKAESCFDAWAKDSYLATGLAISPEAAANCVSDYKRSVVFIRAAYQAIKASQSKFTHSKIKVLYAGCGPFATQILPLLVKFTAKDLQLTFIDMHQESLDSVKLILNFFQLNEYDIQLEVDDACLYQPNEQQHVIITETMQKAIEQEPQYQITKNLAPFLISGGIFIPEKIQITLCLIDATKERETYEQFQLLDSDELILQKKRYYIGNVLCLEANKLDNKIPAIPYKQSCGTFKLPDEEHLENFDLVFMTQIQIYKKYQLNEYESDLTLPAFCSGLPPLKQRMKLAICYIVDSYPKFKVSLLKS